MKSVMTHDFSRIAQTDAPRSTFDRSHGLKTAFDSGYLVPIEVQEVLPGDTVEMDAAFLGRTAPTVTPIMDNVFFDTQWFFVPSRLVWNNFTKMMGERINPNDSIDYLVPQLNSGNGFAVGSLADYFGIPTGVKNLDVNILPFRAYAKIWDDWYRDENLQESIIKTFDDLGDGNPNTIEWNKLLKRGKRHDYFTSALPWPQKGDAVQIPLGSDAPVYGYSGQNLVLSSNSAFGYSSIQTSGSKDLSLSSRLEAGTLNVAPKGATTAQPNAGLYADLSSATAATINSLRLAFQLQKLLERDARSGTRFVELIRAHFATICPDARLQRSEYLGGSSDRIEFNQIAQTSSTNDVTPQGNLTANGKTVGHVRWTKSFTEHGYIIGLASVRCDLNYQQGLNRMWSRKGRYDFFWPVLQNCGEQSVLNKEIYCQGADVKDETTNQVIDDQVFGYQERYAEYRYNPSLITGKMRSTASGTLDIWHLAQKFTSLPKLNAQFIQESPPLKRVLTVTNEPEIILDAYLGQKWTRPMGLYSIPGLIDHL